MQNASRELDDAPRPRKGLSRERSGFPGKDDLAVKRRIVGTAGHIDHGKTSLVRTLTGIDCDRLPEEKRRGITIDLGFAHWIEGDLQLGFVDVPGHEKFVKHMLAGVGGIDCAMLVIAADESVMPQTREHLAICELLHIPTGVIALTKSDLVEPEMLDLIRLEAEELVRGTFLEGKPVVAVSSVSGANGAPTPSMTRTTLATVRSSSPLRPSSMRFSVTTGA